MVLIPPLEGAVVQSSLKMDEILTSEFIFIEQELSPGEGEERPQALDITYTVKKCNVTDYYCNVTNISFFISLIKLLNSSLIS